MLQKLPQRNFASSILSANLELPVLLEQKQTTNKNAHAAVR
jgi:hypothetical protein